MSDSIRPIRFLPQLNKLNPRGKTGDKKGNKEGKKNFSMHMSASDNDVEGKGHNQVKKDCKNSEHKKQNDINTLQEKKADDFDNSCGNILDTKI
ncbi:MAG: hypothetical protein ACUZ9M_02095 [Candidatus Scalindua sp.]